MAAPNDGYQEFLRQIAEADAGLMESLHARARAYKAFAALRAANPDAYFADPRDVDIIAKARESGDDFPDASVEPVLREVMAACQALLSPVTVAFAGTLGSFAHGAARQHFGTAAQISAIESVEDVVESVQRGRARYGIVPFETTSDGAVTATLLALLASDVRICAELTVPASYHLVSKTGNGADVEKIYGSSVALLACEKQLRRLCPNASIIDVPSGEEAVEFALEDHGAAAAVPAFLGRDHALRTVHERVEDTQSVEVRFAVIGTDHPARTGLDRTVLALAVSDQPGELHRSLKSFAERDINLTRVESRPARGAPWRYFFFLELDGHITDRVILTAVEELRSTSPMVKVLGSYARPS